MSRHDPELTKAFKANRAAIADVNRAAIRQLMIERDAKIAAAAKSDLSWADLGASLHRIDHEFHTAAEQYRKPLPEGTGVSIANQVRRDYRVMQMGARS